MPKPGSSHWINAAEAHLKTLESFMQSRHIHLLFSAPGPGEYSHPIVLVAAWHS